MSVCPHCQAPVVEGLLFCEECGGPLVPVIEDMYTTSFTGQLSVLASRATLTLEGPGRWLLGRGRGTASLQGATFIDLSPYGAYMEGVSRRHALLEISPEGRAYLTDLDSSNGTWVDHIRLQPHRPFPLPATARIRLGRMVLQWQHLSP